MKTEALRHLLLKQKGLQIMANILDFKPRVSSTTVHRNQKAPAEIIIFPGVRYERMGGGQIFSSRRETAPRSKGSDPVLLQG